MCRVPGTAAGDRASALCTHRPHNGGERLVKSSLLRRTLHLQFLKRFSKIGHEKARLAYFPPTGSRSSCDHRRQGNTGPPGSGACSSGACGDQKGADLLASPIPKLSNNALYRRSKKCRACIQDISTLGSALRPACSLWRQKLSTSRGRNPWAFH